MLLRKKQKADSKEARPGAGIYVTRNGLCSIFNLSPGWINDHITTFGKVDNLFSGNLEYFSVSDVYMLLNPSMSRKEADNLAFSTVLSVKRINKIIVEKDAK